MPNRIPMHFSINDVGGKLFLTVSEVCALLDADPRSIRKDIRQGRIPHTQVGREYRIPISWIREQAYKSTGGAT